MIHDQLESLSHDKTYEKNFIQLQKIGQGGFASVYKVMHKLDSSEYAVKQIQLKIKDFKDDLQKRYEKMIREAKYLAQVNHPNVIRYYNSWLEVAEKKKSQKKEEQKRQAIELSSFQAQQLLKIPKEQKEGEKVTAHDSERIKNGEVNRTEKAKTIGNVPIHLGEDYKRGDGQEQLANQNHKKLQQNVQNEKKNQEERKINNSNEGHKGTHGNNHHHHHNEREEAEEETNEDFQSFFFECEDGEEVVFEEASKACNDDHQESSSSSAKKEIQLHQVQVNDSSSDGKNEEQKEEQEAANMEESVDKNKMSQTLNQSDFQLIIESSDCSRKSPFGIKETQIEGELLGINGKSAENQEQVFGEDKINNCKINNNNKSKETNENNEQLSSLIQQQLMNQQGSQLTNNTRSMERRKNKSVDYLTIGQQRREVELDRYDKIVFYLQTELCHQTLAEFLANRNKKIFSCQSVHLSEEQKWQAIQILKQVIKGLFHIHHVCKMVHLDLKPHNIFLTDSLQAKIGDFGLVKKLSKLVNPNQAVQYNDSEIFPHKTLPALSAHNSHSLVSTSPSDTHSGMHDKLPFYLPKEEITSTCGTATYASPEQMSTKAEFFDHRADIYSLGIIILQLFHPMNTTMEVVTTIKNCKQGELPKKFCSRFPKLSEIIKDSLSNDPQKRPILSKIESTLLEMEIKDTQPVSESLGKLFVSFEYDSHLFLKFGKIIRNSLFLFKSESQEKADFAYNLLECDLKLQTNQQDHQQEIQLSHQIQQNITLRSSSNERTEMLIQNLLKFQFQ